MHLLEYILIGIGLAADASVVAFGSGSSGKIGKHKEALNLSLSFGFFQFAMPVIGWYCGTRIAPFVINIDHWIAFDLLSLIGLKMIIDSFYEDGDDNEKPHTLARILILSIATSIDALVVGFSFAFLSIPIWFPGLVFGIVTIVFSAAGVYSGKFLGKAFGRKMELVGGLILIAIGFRILYLHLYTANAL
jgi:putative Mn2+ efflux pump MntP